jgi:hypothetical protein
VRRNFILGPPVGCSPGPVQACVRASLPGLPSDRRGTLPLNSAAFCSKCAIADRVHNSFAPVMVPCGNVTRGTSHPAPLANFILAASRSAQFFCMRRNSFSVVPPVGCSPSPSQTCVHASLLGLPSDRSGTLPLNIAAFCGKCAMAGWVQNSFAPVFAPFRAFRGKEEINQCYFAVDEKQFHTEATENTERFGLCESFFAQCKLAKTLTPFRVPSNSKFSVQASLCFLLLLCVRFFFFSRRSCRVYKEL